MKSKIITLICLFVASFSLADAQEQHIEKLVLKKKEKKSFSARDSSLVLHIDTLIMRDKSSLQFYGKKDVTIVAKHVEMGDKVVISGSGSKNNASNFDIDMNFKKLGSLYVIARGDEAMNGTKTDPNGDGGTVNFSYDSQGIAPQTASKKAKNYLFVDVSAGGRTTNPSSDLSQIYGRIASSPTGLRGIPQGQIYSGSPGKEGKVNIQSK